MRSGIAKSRAISSRKNESRNTGSHWEDHLQQCHLLQCLAPILSLFQNAIMIIICRGFFQINMLLMLIL